jgi:hypothetical protein
MEEKQHRVVGKFYPVFAHYMAVEESGYSVPASGSVDAMPARQVPLHTAGRYFRFSSCVLKRLIICVPK